MTSETELHSPITAEIITWLDGSDFSRPLDVIRQWDEATWQIARRVAIIQGIGPYLSQILPQTPLYPLLPNWFQSWLNTAYTLNGERIARLHADLQILLREASRAEIPVLLLKGSLLSARFYPQPAMRPMADIDLLVQATDRYKIQKVMEENGYRLTHPQIRWWHHDMYANTTTETVVTLEEHPDNPRHIEIHFNLDQKIWACYDLPDLSAEFWKTSTVDTFLGESVHIPSPENHLAFIAMHNLRHLFFNAGRAIQWLDIAYMVKVVPDLGNLPHLALVYPALRFAARVFPSSFSHVDWISLDQQIPPRLRIWSETAPLDARCGLEMRTKKNTRGPWRLRWIRWHPNPARLALIYGDTPLPLAYLRYSKAVLQHVVRLVTKPKWKY